LASTQGCSHTVNRPTIYWWGKGDQLRRHSKYISTYFSGGHCQHEEITSLPTNRSLLVGFIMHTKIQFVCTTQGASQQAVCWSVHKVNLRVHMTETLQQP
jgi:hypothetical protein